MDAIPLLQLPPATPITSSSPSPSDSSSSSSSFFVSSPSSTALAEVQRQRFRRHGFPRTTSNPQGNRLAPIVPTPRTRSGVFKERGQYRRQASRSPLTLPILEDPSHLSPGLRSPNLKSPLSPNLKSPLSPRLEEVKSRVLMTLRHRRSPRTKTHLSLQSALSTLTLGSPLGSQTSFLDLRVKLSRDEVCSHLHMMHIAHLCARIRIRSSNGLLTHECCPLISLTYMY